VFGNHAVSGRWFPGQLGVTVFFFLSGFLITTLMRAEYEKNGTVNLRHFWLRRALRILPPLYVMVLGSALLAGDLSARDRIRPGKGGAAAVLRELLPVLR
jgi:peptidoglycan/LPS O-acetylase OafA/YrhL